MNLGSNCILQTDANTQMLEKLLPNVPASKRYIKYSSILPYLADYMLEQGMISAGVDNNPTAVTEKVEENIEALKGYCNILLKVLDDPTLTKPTELDAIVFNKLEDDFFQRMIYYYDLVDNKLDNDILSLAYDVKFQLILKKELGLISQEDLSEVLDFLQNQTDQESFDEDVSQAVDISDVFDTPTKTTQQTNTNITYKKEFVHKPLNIQLDDIKFKMSAQDKRVALDIIADSFYNIINTVLQKYQQQILQQAKERGITVAKRKVQIERLNKELFDSINREQSFKKPNQDFIKKLQSQIIPLTELDVVKNFGVKNIVDIIRKSLQSNPKTGVISENFDALLRQAASKINNIYGINILGNTELFDNDNDAVENSNDQSNSDLNNESAKDDYAHADDKTICSERSLTKELKLAYRQCFVTNPQGRVLTNSFGYKIPVDISAAHNKILHLLEGMIDVDDVIPLLNRSTEGWVKQFVQKLQKDPKLLNNLYFCYKLSAQDYRICFLQDGYLIQKSINRLSQEELIGNETTSNVVNGILQANKKYSIYDTKGKINKEGLTNSRQLLKEITDDVIKIKDVYDESLNLESRLEIIFNALGVSLPSTYNLKESIALYNVENNKSGLLALLKNINNFYDEVEKKKQIDTRDNYLNSVFTFIGKSDIGYVESSVSEKGKSYYTYAKTNYIDELILHIKQSVRGKKTADGRNYYEDWREKQFGQSSFFKNPITGEYYSDWMRKLFGTGSKYDVYRDIFGRCSVLHSLGVDYVSWDDVISMKTNYAMYDLANPNLKGQRLGPNEAVAWYRMPIASDSNAGDYIQFIKYVSDTERTYDDVLADRFWEIAKQELVRIDEVTKHLNQKLSGEHTSADIKNYDVKQKNGIITDAGGMVFTLLSPLNYVKVNVDNHSIFNKIQPKHHDKFNEASLLDVLRTLMSKRTDRSVVTESITDNDLKQFFTEVFYETFDKDFEQEYVELDTDDITKEDYREYYYNYMYAWLQTVELTSTDTAFFGKRKVKEVDSAKEADFTHVQNVVENGIQKVIKHHYKIVSDDTLITFQKRNKEYHAPTNKTAIRKPYFKEIYLEDVEIPSAIAANAINIINNNPRLNPVTKKRLINIYNKDTNVVDGQSYRSLKSYMELLDAQGQLTDDQRDSFNRIINTHQWDEGDLSIITLAIKPYVYSTVPHVRSTQDKAGHKNVVMSPTQHKNSELPLTAALGAISASLNNSVTLIALDKFMTDHNIDVVHFNSVIKVGETGTITIDAASTDVNEVVGKLEKACGFDVNIEGNPEIVHNIPTANWGIQLTKPEHLLDAHQLINSQIRRAILTDIPDDATIYINDKPYIAAEFKKHYQELISASLIEDFSSVDEIFKDPKKLESFLQESIASSTKYDEDLLEMFTWDSENQRFRMPFWNQTVANRVEELLLALVKNRIGKQKIAGGVAVQTAALGLDKDLNVRYKKDGEILMTYNEFKEKYPKADEKEFERYVEGATLAYMECYLPMWSKDMIEALTDEDGTLHYENLPEELKYMVGYRIPYEDHYSGAPLYIKGFLPNLNASTIMLPADITTITGSDFDIDVQYLMRHEFTVTKYNEEALLDDYSKLFKDNVQQQKAILKNVMGLNANQDLDDVYIAIESQIDNMEDEQFKDTFINYQRWRNQHLWDTNEDGSRKYLLPKGQWKLKKIKYDTAKSALENSKKARNNEFIDSIIGCLQSPHSRDKFTNVGNYDELKETSRIMEILQHPANTKSLDQLMKLSLDQLNDIVSELNKDTNQSSPQMQTKLHQQNMQGNQLKGIFVAAKGLQEIIQHTPIKPNYKFVINGNFSINDDFRIGKIRAADGTLITKRFASWVAAAVDNGKDPMMLPLKVNTKNVAVVNYLTLLGYPPIEIATFMNCADIELPALTEEEIEDINSNANDDRLVRVLDLYLMASAIQHKDNITNYPGLLAVVLKAKSVMQQVNTQARLLSSLAGSLKADSLKFDKSIMGNFRYADNIDKFIIDNEKFDTFNYERLPIKPIRTETKLTRAQLETESKNAALPYLQTFTDCLYSASFGWLAPYSLHLNEGFKDMAVFLSRHGGSKANDIMTNFIDAYQRISVLDSYVFGDEENINLRQKREILVNDFPKQFAQFKQNLPKELKYNTFIDNIILVAPNRQDKYFHLEVKELGKNKDIRAKFKTDCDRLAAYHPTMALKLFVYTTFRNGFGYSQKGWAHLTSVNMQNSIPEYTDILYNMKNTSEVVINNLIVQFAKNGNMVYRKVKDLDKAKTKIDAVITKDRDKYVTVDGGLNWIPIPKEQPLGYGSLYHEYFKAGEPQISIFEDKSDVSEERYDIYEDMSDDAYKTNQEELRQPEQTDKQSLNRVPKKNQKGDDGTNQC